VNKFAALTKAEIEEAAAVTLTVEKDEAGDLVAPVPADAPALPSHPAHGEPVARWSYHSADGCVLFYVCRFEPAGERKQIVPLSLWRDALGALRWRWRGVPSPRPLFNLDKLTNNPAAPVIVTEGEKAAEAVEKIYGRAVVATTSPGGAQAAHKSDWTPLAGRRVLIWPDADEPGARYAKDVAEILAGLRCDVSILDAMALVKVSPDGGEREPVAGYDAADAAAEWRDVVALRSTVKSLCKSYHPGPAFYSFGAFTMGEDGLFVEVTKGRGDNAEIVDEFVSAPFEVLGATRSGDGHDWGKWLRWRDGDKREHLRHVSDAALQGDPAALAATLASDGLRIARTQQRALASYLSAVTVKGRVTMVARTGWHCINGRDVFVLPGETIGPRGGETVILEASAHGPYETRGTLDDWRAGVGALAADHRLAVLAVSTALAGPLLYLAGLEGGGLNFYGPSSKGKSTLLQIGASVWGRGASPGYVRAWRATANGLEGAAASATDTALILDELGVVEARDAAAAVYGLSNGSGKARASRDGSLREPKSWRVIFLSSGEIPIATKLQEDRGRRARAGQLVRLLDIPADAGKGFGAFDSGGPDGDAGALSKRMKQAAQSAFGMTGPEFVRRLIAEKIDGETVRNLVSQFVAATVPAGADGQCDRAAQRLGLIMAAGELATMLGVTPWREGAARDAAQWALAQWIEGRGGVEPAEARQSIEAVRLIIEAHGESRFEQIEGESEARPVNNRLGWRRGEGPDREWLIPPEIWKSEICAGLDPKAVARALGERGMLQKASDGWQCVVKIDGTARRVFVVLSTIFAGVAHGA
jgi:putative DNA primase/helicase